MTIIHMSCAECGKTVAIKGSFWTEAEITALGNMILFPHYLKYHKEKITAKIVFKMCVNVLYLLIFVPIHVILFLIYYFLYPLYLLLEKLYG